MINEAIPGWIRIKHCRKVITKDLQGRENGFLIDILNRHDEIYAGREAELFQQVYYSSVYRGMFKGFHIHRLKYDTVTCVFGKALLVFYPEIIPQSETTREMDMDKLVVVPLDTQENILTVSFPSKYPHGYYGVSELAYILNYRNPAWHPGDDHQYDHNCEGIEIFLDKWIKNNEIG